MLTRKSTTAATSGQFNLGPPTVGLSSAELSGSGRRGDRYRHSPYAWKPCQTDPLLQRSASDHELAFLAGTPYWRSPPLSVSASETLASDSSADTPKHSGVSAPPTPLQVPFHRPRPELDMDAVGRLVRAARGYVCKAYQLNLPRQPPHSVSCARVTFAVRAALPHDFRDVVLGHFDGSFHKFVADFAGIGSVQYSTATNPPVFPAIGKSERRLMARDAVPPECRSSPEDFERALFQADATVFAPAFLKARYAIIHAAISYLTRRSCPDDRTIARKSYLAVQRTNPEYVAAIGARSMRTFTRNAVGVLRHERDRCLPAGQAHTTDLRERLLEVGASEVYGLGALQHDDDDDDPPEGPGGRGGEGDDDADEAESTA